MPKTPSHTQFIPAPVYYDIAQYSLSSGVSRSRYQSSYRSNSYPHKETVSLGNLNLPPLNLNNNKPGSISLPCLPDVIKYINQTSPLLSEISNSSITTPKEGPFSTFEETMNTKLNKFPINNVTNNFSTTNGQPMKRPRRLFSQVNRIFKCDHPGCTKAYGALNHLNSHILTQNHGIKKKACEFYHLTRP